MGTLDSLVQKTEDFVNSLVNSFDEEHRLQLEHDKLKAKSDKKKRIQKLKEENEKLRAELGKP